MRAEYGHRMLPLLLALLLAGCGASAIPTAQRGAVVVAAPTRSLAVVPSHAATATVAPLSPLPSRAVATGMPPSDCNALISASYPRFDSVATLAWVSHQIIVGVVIEQRAPTWVALDASTRRIYTDYVVRVDHQLRGFPAATVVVRRLGGTLDGCTHENPSQPPLATGDALLLFLHESMPSNTPPQPYFIIGGPQGQWRLKPDGTVAPALTNAYPEAADAQVEGVAAQVHAALSIPPPQAAPPQLVVPLDRAPLPAVPTPATPTR